MREIQIDRAPDGTPERMRFGADDLAGPFPARAVGEVLVPRYILAPDASGEPRIWERHPTEPERDHGGAAGVCIYVRLAAGEDYVWLRSGGARRFYDRRDAVRALTRAKRVTVGDLIDAEVG